MHDECGQTGGRQLLLMRLMEWFLRSVPFRSLDSSFQTVRQRSGVRFCKHVQTVALSKMRITALANLWLMMALLVAVVCAAPTDVAAQQPHFRSKRTIGFFLQHLMNSFTAPPPPAKALAPAATPVMMMPKPAPAPVPVAKSLVSKPPPATTAAPRPPIRYNFFGVAFPFPSLFTVAGTASPAASPQPAPAQPAPAAPAAPPAAIPAPIAPVPNKFFFEPPQQLPIPSDPTPPAAPQSTLPPPPPPTPSLTDTTVMPAADDAAVVDSDSADESPESPTAAPVANAEDNGSNSSDDEADRAAFFSGPDSFRRFWQNAQFNDDGSRGSSSFGGTDGDAAANRYQFNLDSYNNGGNDATGFYNAPQHLRRAATTPNGHYYSGQQAVQPGPGAHSSVKMHDNDYQYFTYHGNEATAAATSNINGRIGRQVLAHSQYFGKTRSSAAY